MIPVTTLTDLYDEHAKHAMILCKCGDFATWVQASGERAEFLRVHIGELDEFDLATDGTVVAGFLAVPFRRAKEVRVGVTGIGVETTRTEHVEYGRLPARTRA